MSRISVTVWIEHNKLLSPSVIDRFKGLLLGTVQETVGSRISRGEFGELDMWDATATEESTGV